MRASVAFPTHLSTEACALCRVVHLAGAAARSVCRGGHCRSAGAICPGPAHHKIIPKGVILGQWWPLGVPKGPKAPQRQILVTFGAPFGSPRGALWGSFWLKISKSEGLCRLFGALYLVSEEGATTGLSSGGRTCDPLTRPLQNCSIA